MGYWRVVGLILLSVLCVAITFAVLFYMENIASAEWYIKIAVAFGLFVGYAVLIKVASKNGLARSRISALVLIIVAFPIFGYALIGVSIPQTRWFQSLNVEMVSPDGTPFIFSIDLNFSSVGTFSAENPVHVRAVINNVNISDLTAHLGAISFTNAYNVVEKHIAGDVPAYGFIPLYQSKNGEYTAEGDFIWHQSETCYIIPLPPFQGTIKSPNLNNQQLYGSPVLYISPVSDTLSSRSNHVIEQLTYVVVGFSIIMLQPVINALFPDKAAKPQNPENHAQGKTHYKQHQKGY